MKRMVLFGMLLASFGSYAQSHPATGIYKDRGGWVSNSIDLQPDGTCIWLTRGCLSEQKTVCKWTDSNNVIVIRGTSDKTEWDDKRSINVVATYKKDKLTVRTPGEKGKTVFTRKPEIIVAVAN